jgi:hypothetical protein
LKKGEKRMSFIVEKKNDYVPPPEGSYSSVICDIADLGEVGTAFGTKHMCRISFQLDEPMPKGNRFVVSRRYAVSLHHSSALRGLLITLLGADFDGERVDLEDLIGLPCLVAIEHNESQDGNLYGNVATVTKLPRGMQPITVKDYTRHRDRDSNKPNGQVKKQSVIEKPKPACIAVAEPEGVGDDDVSF